MTETNELLSQAFILDVCQTIETNGAIQKALPGGGFLHIDRRLPFICLYRQPKTFTDVGTSDLLLGQASYILVAEQVAESANFKHLLTGIAAMLSKGFGTFLFFEIWATTQNDEDHCFRLELATTSINPPQSMLEDTEDALLDVSLVYDELELRLHYIKHLLPGNMKALFNEQQLLANNQFWLGLGIAPVYRRNNKVLPYEIKLLKAAMTKALRRMFYAFIHAYTSHTPAHYHELGHRSISEQVLKIDHQLAKIRDQFDILFHVTPVNTDEAWEKFKQSGFDTQPVFKYRSRPIDPNLLKRKLYGIEIESIEDPALLHLFLTQREEISRLLTMIDDRNTANFQYGSLQVYGAVDSTLKAAAKQIFEYNAVAADGVQDRPLNAQAFAKEAAVMLSEYQKQCQDFHFALEIRDDVPGILVSRGKLMVGQSATFSRDRVQAILAHEIGTHIVTYFNGMAQPFQQFHSGMSDYEGLQEGLAVFSEFLVGGLSRRRMHTLAGRIYAVDAMTQGAEFNEVFRLLTDELGFSVEQAFLISMRVFRGGGFTKDVVYLRGLLELIEYLQNHQSLEILYIGKIATKHLSFIKELKWRTMLNDIRLTPHYLHTPQAKQKIDLIRNSQNVIATLLEEHQ